MTTTAVVTDQPPALSDLDARIQRDVERSGVPFHVEDPAVLSRVAALVVEGGDRDAGAAP